MEKVDYKENIIIKKGLSEETFEDILELMKVCEQQDNPNPIFDNISHPPKGEDCTYLLYLDNQKKIIAYLAIYPSSIAGQVKITGKVHPSYRRGGIFSILLNEGKNICFKNKINEFVFINDQISDSGKAFCLAKGAKYQSSSYRMDFDVQNWTKNTHVMKNFSFKSACEEDMDDIVKIGMDGFGTSEDEERKYNENNMKNPNKDIYIGQYNNKNVSIISIVYENKLAYICDLVVISSYRRKGLGKKMLSETISKILNKNINKISLGVESNNRNALSLYEDCEFRIKSAFDFYSLDISK